MCGLLYRIELFTQFSIDYYFFLPIKDGGADEMDNRCIAKYRDHGGFSGSV
jgi:hypothetical protein